MLRQIELNKFLEKPEQIIREAAKDLNPTAVKIDNSKAIIISETEWWIMCQGLKLLFDHATKSF